MLHLNPAVKGRHVKLGVLWSHLDDIVRSQLLRDGQGDRLVITRKGGKPAIVYRGARLAVVREVLRREGKET